MTAKLAMWACSTRTCTRSGTEPTAVQTAAGGLWGGSPPGRAPDLAATPGGHPPPCSFSAASGSCWVGAMQRSRLPAGVRFSLHLAGDADKSFGPCSLGDDAHGQAKRLNPPVKGTSPSSSPPCLARAFSLQISPSLPPGSSNGPGRRALMHIPINRV